LSEKNRGGIFVIIKETQARYCHSMNQDIAFEKRLIDTIPDYQLINFADLDGALILDINRELLAVGQRLEAPPVDWYYEESGRGTRHNSASQYSRATNSVVFVISEDGPISLYFNGNLIGRCFKQLFGKK
jgi:DNA integrity scanning protein DisA with diadenylate cyclase activity